MKTQISKDDVLGELFWLWPLFCLQAGFINSGGFLACHRFVSHVTGFGTHVGVELGLGHITRAFEMLLIPVGFIAGGVFAGFLTQSPLLKNKTSHHLISLMIMSLLLAISGAMGVWGYFGSFGEPLLLNRDFILLFILCFSCGIQNATVVAITMGSVRTTHLTGLSTDLGLNFARILTHNDITDRRWLTLRISKLSFFCLGAMLGAMIFPRLQFAGFVCAAISNTVLVWVLYTYEKKYYHPAREDRKEPLSSSGPH